MENNPGFDSEEVRRLVEDERRFVWHPFTQMSDWCEEEPLIIASGKGAILRDVRGREYIDGVAVAYGSGSQDQVRWGDPLGAEKSGLGFTGIAPPGKEIDMDTPFDIGQLQHFNFVVVTGSACTSVDLAVTLDFEGAASPTVFDFSFAINANHFCDSASS